ncbi:MAG TPA: SLC13 family permease [Candidatus Binataceae bacterium]|nr:SLC13 family permease [Candidatus Binataceae bacterium]
MDSDGAIALAIFALTYFVIAAGKGPFLHIDRTGAALADAVAMGALVCFVAGYPTYLVAMGAGVVLLFTRSIRPERVYRLIDWTMLVMFAGLFIAVAGFQTTGLQNDLVRSVGVQHLSQLSPPGRNAGNRAANRQRRYAGGESYAGRLDGESNRCRTGAHSQSRAQLRGLSAGRPAGRGSDADG